jgi:hypothetical protein
MLNLSNKAQFFILTTVIIVGVFYGLSKYLNPYSFIDTSKAVEGDEVFFFNNVKDKAIKTVQIGGTYDELDNHLSEYRNFAQNVSRDNEFILNLNYKINANTVDFSMSLQSQKMRLYSNFTVARP